MSGVATPAAAVVDAMMRAFAAQDVDGVLACYAPGAVETNTIVGEMLVPDEFAPFLTEMFGALDDFDVEIHERVVDGDVVALRYTVAGDFTGGALQGVEPTGRRMVLPAMSFARVEDGAIVRNDVSVDAMAVARQLGVLPPVGSQREWAMQTVFNAKTRLRSLLPW